MKSFRKSLSSSGRQNNAVRGPDQFPPSVEAEQLGSSEYFNPYNPEAWCRYLDLLVENGIDSVRVDFSWPDIFTSSKQINWEVIEGYRQLIDISKRAGVEVMVTILHFTLPNWLLQQGGARSEYFNDYFREYTQLLAENFFDLVEVWFPINEINVLLNTEIGIFPPSSASTSPLGLPVKIVNTRRAKINLVQAHCDAYDIMHATYAERGVPAPRVGPVVNLSSYIPFSNTGHNRLLATVFEEFNYHNLDQMVELRKLDFIGVNYYFTRIVDMLYVIRHALPNRLAGLNHGIGSGIKRFVNGRYLAEERSDLDWSLSPSGFALMMEKMANRYAKHFDGNIPIMITELGVATADQDLKTRYLMSAIEKLLQVPGIDVELISLWTALEKGVYEWNIEGENPPFGVIADSKDGIPKLSQAGMAFAAYNGSKPEGINDCEAFPRLALDDPHSKFRHPDLTTEMLWRPFAKFLMRLFEES